MVEQSRESKNTVLYKALAYYHLIGGMIGIVLLISSHFSTDEARGVFVLLLVLAISLYGFAVACAWIGLRDPNSKLFLKLALANQLIQILVISFDGLFGFKYVCGVGLMVGLNFTTELLLKMNFNISTTLITIGQASGHFVGVNLIALALALWIANTLWPSEKPHPSVL